MTKRLELPKFQAFDGNGDPLSGGLVYTYEVGTTTGKTSYSDYNAATPNANPVVLDSRGEADIYVQGAYKIVLKTSAGATLWTLDNVQGGVGADAGGEDFYYPDATAADQGVTGSSDTIKYAVDTIAASSGTIYLKHDSGTATTTYTLTTSETIPANVTLVREPGVILDGAGTLNINGGFDSGLDKAFGTSITIDFYEGQVEEVFPQWWGAVGDGATDDQVAIQAALDASKGRVCKLPSTYTDSYIVGAPLTIDSGNRLIGSGSSETNGTTIKLDDNVDDNVIESSTWTAQSGYIHWFEIAWININGSKASNASTSCGIAIYGMGETSEIHNVQIEDVNDYGLRLSGVGAPNRIRNVKFQDCGVAAVYDDQTGGAVTTYDQLSGDDNQIFYKFGGRANRLMLHTKAEGLHNPYCDIQLTDVSGGRWPITDIGSNADATGESVTNVFSIDSTDSSTVSLTLINFRQANYTNLINDVDTGEAYPVESGNIQPGIRLYNGQTRCFGSGSGMFIPFNVPLYSEASFNSGTDVEILKQTGAGLRFQDATGGGFLHRETGMSAAETVFRHRTTELTAMSGATVTWASGIPAGTIVLGVTARVTTLITGATSFDIGEGGGGDADLFVDGMAVALDTTADNENSNVSFTAPKTYQTATDILVTGVGGSFTAGALRLVLHYIDLTAPTS